jgi:hypothetical protein
MVYWGCKTPRNKAAWTGLTAALVIGSTLLIAGGARLSSCAQQSSCGAAPPALIALGAVTLLGVIPALLFFSGCAKGPAADVGSTLFAGDARSSAITVVRRTTTGAAAVYQYDAGGRLVVAPDCLKHKPMLKTVAALHHMARPTKQNALQVVSASAGNQQCRGDVLETAATSVHVKVLIQPASEMLDSGAEAHPAHRVGVCGQPQVASSVAMMAPPQARQYMQRQLYQHHQQQQQQQIQHSEYLAAAALLERK